MEPTTREIIDELNEILTAAIEIGALQAAKIIKPVKDEISMREAVKVAGGGAWIKYQCEHKKLRPVKMGKAQNSKFILSRIKIKQLKLAELTEPLIRELRHARAVKGN